MFDTKTCAHCAGTFTRGRRSAWKWSRARFCGKSCSGKARGPRSMPRRPAADRFEALWMPEPMTGCHLWVGGVDHHGYGLFWNGERSIGAHRFAFELVNGPVPEGLHVLHHCDTPACCNPLHLYAGTPADNVRDALERGRFAVGSRAAMARTTEAVVALGRARRLRAREFARETGLSLSAARQALNGETWRHLPLSGQITGITCSAA